MHSPTQIQQRYEGQGPVGYLLGVTDFAMQNLQGISVSPFDLFRKDSTGDIVTEMDRCVHDSIVKYFQAIEVPVAILGEEGQSHDAKPEYALLVDEIEGTQNAVNGLPHGINIAIAPYRSRLRVRDLEAAVVTNLYDERIFVGERGKGAYKVQDGERCELDSKQTDVYECPSPFAYTTDLDQIDRQKYLTNIFRKILGNQPRSIDATGTRIVELADGKIRAYGDWRHATKCWDVLPSELIVREAGYVLTDVLGFDLSEAVFYDRNNPNFDQDGGLNRIVGRNFIAANIEDHERLVFGDGKNNFPQHPYAAPKHLFNCTWDFFHTYGLDWFNSLWDTNGDKKGDFRVLSERNKKEFLRVLSDSKKHTEGDRKKFWRDFGQKKADIFNEIVECTQAAYLGLDPGNVKEVHDRYRGRFVDIVSGTWEEKAQGFHLKTFDEGVQLSAAV